MHNSYFPMYSAKNTKVRNSPASQWLSFHELTAWVQVQSLVGELRSHEPHGAAKNKTKQTKVVLPGSRWPPVSGAGACRHCLPGLGFSLLWLPYEPHHCQRHCCQGWKPQFSKTQTGHSRRIYTHGLGTSMCENAFKHQTSPVLEPN